MGGEADAEEEAYVHDRVIPTRRGASKRGWIASNLLVAIMLAEHIDAAPA